MHSISGQVQYKYWALKFLSSTDKTYITVPWLLKYMSIADNLGNIEIHREEKFKLQEGE